jgi:transcriptional regulator with XRE-family HTH domain
MLNTLVKLDLMYNLVMVSVSSGEELMMRGDRIRMLREDRGLSQDALAHALSVGIATIQRVEYSKNTTTETIRLLAEFFLVSTDYLIGLTDNPQPGEPTDLTEPERAIISAIRRDDARTTIKIIAERF